MKKLLLVTLLFSSMTGLAQDGPTILLPQADPKAIEAAAKNEGSPIYHFALSADVSYTLDNCGAWQELQAGGRIWKARFSSPGSKNLHFILRDLVLPKGATIRAYSEGGRPDADLYDEQNVTASPYFGIWPVHGDDVWLEYFEPAEATGEGYFEIFRIGLGYKDVYTKSGGSVPVPPPSLECNYDVECFMDGIESLKNHNKKSVCLILGDNNDGGIFLASGALVNNTANDGKPYILSANHAWVDGAIYTFRFNWRNPEPDCPSSGWGDQAINPNHTVTGAVLRARRDKTDFLLMEIESELAEDWDLVWSGWDRSGIPTSFTYGIHHPAGDIMKICRDYDSPEILDEENGDIKWLINHWELGTTEGGSSGSPLFTDEGRIIGQLWAGASACIGSEPNGALDVYGRFDVSWDAGETVETRLKEWLDPGDTGAFTLDAYPEMPLYALDGAIKFIEEGVSFCQTETEPVLRLINNGTTPITTAIIEYSLNESEPQILEWEGMLEPNEGAVINMPEVASEDGENVFTISLASVNGESDENGDNNVLALNFDRNIYETNDIIFELLTDNFGEDISWEITTEDGTVVANGGPYESSQEYTESFELTNGCYQFTLTDSYGDGICCEHGIGGYTLMAGDEVIVTGGDFGRLQQVNFVLDGALGLQSHTAGTISIYPNPSQGLFTVSLYTQKEASYALYTLLGQELAKGTFAPGANLVDISGMAGGIYLLRVTDSAGRTVDSKIIRE